MRRRDQKIGPKGLPRGGGTKASYGSRALNTDQQERKHFSSGGSRGHRLRRISIPDSSNNPKLNFVQFVCCACRRGRSSLVAGHRSVMGVAPFTGRGVGFGTSSFCLAPSLPKLPGFALSFASQFRDLLFPILSSSLLTCLAMRCSVFVAISALFC